MTVTILSGSIRRLKASFHFRQRDLFHSCHELVEIVQRQVVIADHGQVAEDFLVAVDAQRETADRCSAWHAAIRPAVGPSATKRRSVARTTSSASFGLIPLGLQADLERSRLRQRHEIAVHAVGQAAFLAHLFGQARGKAAAAQNIVADDRAENNPDRCGSCPACPAGYGSGWRDAADATVSPWRSGATSGNGGKAPCGARQAGGELLGDGFGLLPGSHPPPGRSPRIR